MKSGLFGIRGWHVPPQILKICCCGSVAHRKREMLVKVVYHFFFFFFFAYYVGPIQNNNTAIKINENIQKNIVLHIKYSKELYAVCRLYVCRKKGKSNSG